MSRRWLIAGLIVAVPLVAWGVLAVASFALRTTIEDSASISEPVSNVLVKGDGDVDVVAADGTRSVAVEWKSRYFVDRPEVSWRVIEGQLVLDSDCGTFGVITNCSTSFTLRVPRGLPIDVDTSSGDVEVEGTTGPLRVVTSSGDLSARVSAPSIVLDTSSGNVVIEGSSPEIVASTSSGDVNVSIADEPPTRVEAETSSGDVRIRVPYAAYDVEADTDSGDDDVQGIRQDGRAPRTIVARSSSGDVSVGSADESSPTAE